MRRRELLLEACEDRILCDGTPDVTLSAPADAKIGEQVQVTATFDNTAADAAGNTGFGPYIDLVLKATGEDGNVAAGEPNDGVTFVNATYLGAPVSATVLTFDANGQAIHPFAKDAGGNPLVVDAPPGYGEGDQLVVLRLPFGSFAPDQPPAPVLINLQTSNLADVGAPLQISARGGFIYTNDGADQPEGGASIIDPTYANTTVTPQVFTLNKVYIGPEDETATGPNFTRQYRIEVDVATGQTLTDLQITDLLPVNLQFVQVDSLTGGNGAYTSISTPSTAVPGGTLTRSIGSVTGVDGVDAVLTFSFYVPQLDAGGSPVINPGTGDDATAANNASATANWDPLDARDTDQPVTVDEPGPEHVLTPKSIATQKSVAIVNDTGATGATPGDTLEYTIQIQVSDYFAFQNLQVEDLISDGQRLDAAFTPTMAFQNNPSSGAAAVFAPGNYTFVVDTGNPGSTGITTLTFDISGELIDRGNNGKLVGGLVNPITGAILAPNGDGPTTVTIRYRTVIQDEFSDNFPSGDPSLNPNDTLNNDITVTGDLLQNTPGLPANPNGNSEADTSAAGVVIAPSSVSKSVYAVNGNTSLPANIIVKPGDTVTYRIRYTIPTGDVENLVISDYLPTPFFNASEVTTFSAATPTGTPPPAGTAQWGPLETLRLVPGAVPTPVVNTSSNAIIFTYPAAIDDPTNTLREVDILFTVTVLDLPAEDLTFTTNIVEVTENGTNGPSSSTATDSISGITVLEPAIATGGKGIVGYNGTGLTLGGITFTAPGSTSTISGGPVFNSGQANAIAASDLLNGEVDAGDVVRYALVLQNTGRADAYDVRFEDRIISPGYNLPTGATDDARMSAINLTLFRGDGTVLVRGVDYLATLSASGLLDIELVDNYTAGNVNEVGSGGLSRGLSGTSGTPVTNGSNTVIVTYDLTLSSTQPTIANLGATITNTATLYNYASIEGGRDFANPDVSDTASVKLPQPTLAKTLTGTEVVNATNSNTQAVIGELVTYTLTLTLPEGSVAAAQLLDTLDAGLAFVDIVSLTASSGVSFSGSGTPTVTNSGHNLAFNFGTITNSNTDNTVTDTITIVYRAVVLNANTTPNNQAGVQLNNAAQFSGEFADLPTGTAQSYATTVVSAANVTVIEPTLQVAKSVSPGTNVDAGDPVTYQIVISNPTGPTGYELFFTDTLPALIEGYTFTVVDTAGIATDADFEIVGGVLRTVAGADIDVVAGQTITIIVQGTLTAAVQPGQSIINNATIRWSSLNGDVSAPRSTFNAASVERTGDTQTPPPGTNLATTNQSILNNYAATSGNATITILNPAPVKTIDATSEASTGVLGGVERVTIGEIVRYRVVWQIPEGTSNGLVITDLLPAGMQFINDGTATLAFVSSTGTISSSIGSIGTLASVSGDESTLNSINPTFVIPAGQISGGAGNGGDPVFNLGNVINPDRDTTSTTPTNLEFVVIEFNASVLNVAGNQGENNLNSGTSTTNLDNSVRVQTSTSNQTSTPVRVQVSEPAITNLTKTASPGPYDAGDVVTYTVTFGNASGNNASTAFDVVMTDILPAFLTNVQFLTVTSTGAVTGLTGSASGNTITVNASSLAPGATVTVTYRGTIVNNVATGDVITNTANVTYTSLPGSGTAPNATGSTSGTAGSTTGERTGTGGQGADNSVLNNYADTSAVNLTVSLPVMDKSFKDGSLTADDTTVGSTTGASVVIGEHVFYDILVTLPEGVTQTLSINDVVPAGLRIDAIQILTTTAASPLLTQNFSGTFGQTPTLPAPFSGAGTLVLDFGDTVVPGDNIAGNNSFVIRVEATVLNVVGNQTSTSLPNTATISFEQSGTLVTRPDANAANDPTVTVVEPAIATTKTANAATYDAGDPIVFTITLTNTSSQTAYDVEISDFLGPGMLNPTVSSVVGTGTIFVNGVAVAPGTADVVINGRTVEFASNIDMAAGSTLTIQVSGTVSQIILPGQQGTNTVDTQWTSIDGADPDERTGVDGVGGALNDYASTATVTVSVPAAQYGKTLFATSAASTTGNDVTIGETVTYALVVELPEAVGLDLVVIDRLPAGLQYLSFQTVTTAAGSGGLLVADFNGAFTAPSVSGGVGSGGDVTFTFDGIVVDGDNVANNNRFLILVTAQVLDIPANVGLNPPGQTVLTNTAEFTLDGGTTFTTPPVDVTVVEPQMEITKNIVQTTGDAGDVVGIVLTVSNTGTSDAFEVIINDPFPPGMFTSFTAVGTPPGFTFSVSGDTVTYTGGTIAAGDTLTFTLTAVLTQAVQPGQTLSNTASVTQATTLPGVVTGERFEPGDSATDTITIPVGSYTKTLFATSDPNTTGSNVGIGETVTYALKVTLPEGTTLNLSVIDLLPAGLDYESFSLVTTAGASNGLLTADFAGSITGPNVSGGAGSGDDVTFAFPTISVTGDNITTNNSFVILVTARVLDVPGNVGVTPPGQTVLNNQASFDIPTDGQDPDVTPPVPVTVVEPRLQIIKGVDDNTADLGQTLNYTLTISHTAASTEIAYDVLLRDVIPPGIAVDVASIRVNGQLPLLSGIVDSNTSTSSLIDMKFTELDLGDTITITYTATVGTAASLTGTNLENTAKIYWDTDAAEDVNVIRDGGTDGAPDRDLGAVAANEVFDQNTDDAQDTERVTVVANTISGTVYVDQDVDGVFDLTEPGIGNVTLTLTGTTAFGEAFTQTVQTDASGNYTFTGVPTGNYVITETQPAGYLDRTETAGTPFGGTTNNTIGVDDITDIIVPTGSADGIGYNFGEVQGSSLSGFAYRDLNNDGVKDAGELPVITTITLTGTDDLGNAVTLSQTTTALGAYSFTDLRPGTYTITESQPSSLLDGKETVGTQPGPNAGVIDNTTDSNTIANIVLGQNVNGTDNNFGDLPPARLAGNVFEDSNDDGAFDNTESGIPNVTVTLTGTDDRGNAVNVVLTTLADGSYDFTRLRPSDAAGYTITETQPAGFLDGLDSIGTIPGTPGNDVFSDLVLKAGDQGVNNNFGELSGSLLSGRVYMDADNDGNVDLSESGIAGVVVTLTGTDDLGNAVNRTVVTGPLGFYRFANLRPGTYTITETQPAGFFDGKDTLGTIQGTPNGTATNDQFSTIVITDGVAGIGYNFGELTPSSLSGTVYRDLNNNGAIDGAGETGVSGTTITLTGKDDLGQDVSFTATTDGNGNYTFSNLRPSDAAGYTITETQPAGLLDGKDTIGTPGGTPGNDVFTNIILLGGVTGTNNNFGELPPSTIAGNVYIDSNNNGALDPGETPVPGGTTITLTGTDDLGAPVSQTTTTLPDGTYSFENLRPGSYTIVETQPAGVLDGKDTPGTGSVAAGNDTFTNSFTDAGTTSADNNFGELRPSSLSGRVFNDIDNDGSDAGDPGISGVRVTLTGTDDLGNAVSLTTDTGPLGFYSFDDLRPGTYTITESQPVLFLDGIDTLGTVSGNTGSTPGTLSNDQASTIVLEENTTGVGYNFGEIEPASISGKVYVDLNNDGIVDPNEKGIPNTTVTLIGIDDLGNVVIETTTTGPNGNYLFSRLRPGTYAVLETQPGGYLDGIDTVGTLNGATVGVLLGNDQIDLIRLDPGDHAIDYNFGERPIPPKPPQPPIPPDPDTPDKPDRHRPGLVIAFDFFNNFGLLPIDRFDPVLSPIDIWRDAMLPLAPIYSGTANPGATLVIDLYNANGIRVGSTTVMADAGGNWLANFTNVTMRDTPSSVRITQTDASYTFGSGTGKNLRVYYSPAALNPGQFAAMENPDFVPLLNGLNLASPLQLGPTKYGDEFLPAGGVPTGH